MKGLGVFCRLLMLFSCLLILNSFRSHAQELSKEQIEHNAFNSFFQGKYIKAIPGLEQLLEIYPKEEAYNYYLGRCYLHTNSSLDLSIQCLRKAASNSFCADVHYYLAEAYYKSYLLEDAEIALINFLNIAKRKQIKQLEPLKLQASIKQLRKEAFMVHDVSVIARKNLKLEEFSSVYALHLKGKFFPKDESFMLKFDEKSQYQGFMYIPDTSDKGCKLYFPVRGRKGLDIYETTQITYQNYSLPKNLDVINSDYNEEYPFFDHNEQVLYFSSDRSEGLGGYDIYYSKLDSETGTFSEPERLEFPINSPFDDILYVPAETEKNAVFLSNREGVIVEYIANKKDLDKEMGYSSPNSIEKIREVASLPLNTKNRQETVVVENLSLSVEPKVILPYEKVLQEAMEEQLKSDSLKAVLVLHKNSLRNENDVNKRRIIFSKIAVIEGLLNGHQSTADKLFAKVSGMQDPEPKLKPQEIKVNLQVSLAENESNINPHIKISKEVSGIKQFSYTDLNIVEKSKLTIKEEGIAYTTATNSFTIQKQSPYSVDNPIPFGKDLPEGLAFRIQLGAFSQDLPMDTFGGLMPLNAEKVNNRNIVKYYVGVFKSSKDARKALLQVKDYGYTDAFIVPYFNNEKISIQKARELEFSEKNALGKR